MDDTQSYHVGDIASLQAQFTNTASGDPVAPDTVTFYITCPDGALLTVTPTVESEGAYGYGQECTMAGQWKWRAVGTGSNAAVQRDVFTVEP